MCKIAVPQNNPVSAQWNAAASLQQKQGNSALLSTAFRVLSTADIGSFSSRRHRNLQVTTAVESDDWSQALTQAEHVFCTEPQPLPHDKFWRLPRNAHLEWYKHKASISMCLQSSLYDFRDRKKGVGRLSWQIKDVWLMGWSPRHYPLGLFLFKFKYYWTLIVPVFQVL